MSMCVRQLVMPLERLAPQSGDAPLFNEEYRSLGVGRHKRSASTLYIYWSLIVGGCASLIHPTEIFHNFLQPLASPLSLTVGK